MLATRRIASAAAFRALRPFSATATAPAYIELDENKQQLSALVAAPNSKVLAYFTASWCGPCKAIAPQFTALAKEHGAAVQFVKIDIDDNGATAEEVRLAEELSSSLGGRALAVTSHSAPPLCPLPPQAGIASVPTFKSFVHGKSTGQFSGANVPSLQAAVKALVEAK